MTSTRSGALGPFRANTRSLAKAIGAGRTILAVVVALITGLAVLLIERYMGSGDWEWADALADLVKLLATTIVIVGLLDWYRQRRWQQADGTDLRSLTLMAYLIASGWSSPKISARPISIRWWWRTALRSRQGSSLKRAPVSTTSISG